MGIIRSYCFNGELLPLCSIAAVQILRIINESVDIGESGEKMMEWPDTDDEAPSSLSLAKLPPNLNVNILIIQSPLLLLDIPTLTCPSMRG